MVPPYFPDVQQLQTFFDPLKNSNIPPVLNQLNFKDNVALNDNQKNNNGWMIESFTFQSLSSSIQLNLDLRKSSTIGNEENGRVEAILAAFKFIEKCLVDDVFSKKDNKDEVKTLKNEPQNMGETLQKKDIAAQIEELKINQKKDIENLRKEFDRRMKIKCSNWEYKYAMLLRQTNLINKNESEKIKEVKKCTELLEYFRLNNPNEEAKSKECVLAKGICDSVDKVNSWFGNKLQIELVNEQNLKENDSNSEINDFDFLLDDKNEKEKSDIEEAEKE
uniref:Uncharacterized protein n=1 Tax=Meloidogyne enterolobii TaxID=390850 RepID=A0A6V7VZF0_MELEN|nr:unnamed protein product [Meloidogyne enterolobii]